MIIGQCTKEESLSAVNGAWKKMRRLVGIRGVNPVHAGSIFILIVGLVLTTFNIHQLAVLQQEFIQLAHPGKTSQDSSCQLTKKLRFTPYGKNLDSGYLKHVYAVLDRAGKSA